ncbi:MAG: methionyl-tRNA formyltransferase [Candidatus Brocadiia bacterium]
MRIVFAGSSGLAVPCLKALAGAEGHELVGIITQPDRPKGRGLKESQTPVKQAALESPALADLIYQPESINYPVFIDTLAELKPDIMAVVAYGQKLSRPLLELAPQGCVNMHPSLLPKYRGAAPVNHAIWQGETVTGVTIFRLAEKMDAGPIISQAKTDIGNNETAPELAERLSRLGAELLVKAIDAMAGGRASFRAQDDSQATLARKFKKTDGLVDWNRTALAIYNQFRALKPWPGTYTGWNNSHVEIDGAQLISQDASDGQPGQVASITEDCISVWAHPGIIGITRLKPAGHKELNAREFVNGYRIKTGDRLGHQ